MVEDVVNAVEFGQLSAQMGMGSSQQGNVFSMAHMNGSQDLKQEHLMHGKVMSSVSTT